MNKYQGDSRGTIGHAVMRYKSGGSIVTSAGHWKELSRMDVSEEALLRTIAMQDGAGSLNTLLLLIFFVIISIARNTL